ncbi:radical SAM protein [Candidatus Parcubacteria bacterium]|nr:radical SAM protein [Candidatus Parcubacteria bacterium]
MSVNDPRIKSRVFVRIRKEKFGYILFERFTRVHYFVTENKTLEIFSKREIKDFLRGYFGNLTEIEYEFINSQNNSLTLSAPIGMYMEISEKCNLSCEHCYKPKEKTKQGLSMANTKRLIDELYEMGVFEIRLCGNEPTISPHFFEICEYIKSLNLYLGVNTNAYFNESMQEKIIDLRPDFIIISVDGTREIHDSIRTTGSYDKVISFLKRLKKTSIKRRINTLVSKATICSIEHIVQLANSVDAGVSFLPLRTIGKSTNFKKDESMDANSMFSVVKKITLLRKQYPNTMLLTYFDLLSKNAIYHHSMDFNKPCPSRKNGFITYDGDFFPCDFLRYLGDKYFCGNVIEKGFNSLWCNSLILKYFQCLEHKKCKKCKFYMIKCYGGCISGAIASVNKLDDELCFAHLL